jgi:hypothetical protein
MVPHYEVFFGGSAGPGKSSALLMAALQYVGHPGYNALILRKTFQDLAKADALIPRSKEWLMKSDANWNESSKKWTFPSGATLTFGHMDDENAKYNYQGAAWHFIGFDELTHFTETQYMYMHSRCRKAEADPIPLRMRGTGNPGGVGHEWVKNRFVTPPDIEEVTFGMDDEARDEYIEERKNTLFIPAKLQDNPHIAKDYEKNLKRLDAVTRAQLLNGDWDIGEMGNLFKAEWFDNRIITHLPAGVEIIRQVRYWDLASTDEEKVKKMKGAADYTASCLMGLGDDGNVYDPGPAQPAGRGADGEVQGHPGCCGRGYRPDHHLDGGGARLLWQEHRTDVRTLRTHGVPVLRGQADRRENRACSPCIVRL